MKQKRRSMEEIIRILRQADGGQTIREVCREHNISDVTFHRWKRKYGGLKLDDAQKFKGLEKENAELKKMLAETLLEVRALKIINAKKILSPTHKRKAVALLVEEEGYPVRRACRYFALHRSTFQYELQRPQDKHARLIERIEALSWKYPRYGYRRIRALLQREGWTVSKRQVQRLRRLVGLKVKPPKKRVRRRGASTGWLERATHRHQVWSWDFIHDRTDNGGTLKMLTLIDEYTRQCLAIRPARTLKSEDVLEVVQQAVRDHGAPDYLRSDNGSEFIAHLVQDWFREHGIKTIYIEPGSPWQNGWIESFHARLRDECLNRELLLNLREARVVLEDFRVDYNQNRPHSKLGYLSPNQWIEKQASSPDSARPTGLASSRLESTENIS